VLTGGKSFIGRPSGASDNASSGIINLNVGGSDEYALTTAPLSGAFPQSSGNYQLQVTSHGSYVSIGSGLIDVSPSEIFAQGSSSQDTMFEFSVTLPEGGGSPVNVSISISPSYPNAPLSLDDDSFTMASNRSLLLTFSPTASAAGIYNWKMQVNASSCGPGQVAPCPADYLTIPVSLEVGEG
jgi:hypothetical protein